MDTTRPNKPGSEYPDGYDTKQERLDRGKHVLASAVDCVGGRSDASTAETAGSADSGDTGEQNMGMERSIEDCEARYPGEMASTGVQVVLATQVTGQTRKATDRSENHRAD